VRRIAPCTHITYVWTAEGWLYQACVTDLATRRIVGWSMSHQMHANLVCQALRSAYWQGKPQPGLIMHTDCGWIEGFYNRKRRHSAIYHQIPAVAESGLMAA